MGTLVDDHWERYNWEYTNNGTYKTSVRGHTVQYMHSYENPNPGSNSSQSRANLWWKVDDEDWKPAPVLSTVEIRNLLPSLVQRLITWGYIS